MCVRACSITAYEVWAHNLVTGGEAITYVLVTLHHHPHLIALVPAPHFVLVFCFCFVHRHLLLVQCFGGAQVS
jgi:hypothetical protein